MARSDRHTGGRSAARLVCGVFAALLVGGSSAAAQTSPMRVHFSWRAAESRGCSSREELERGVEALLGRRVFVPRDEADAEVDGTLDERDARWVAELTLSNRDGAALGHREIFGTGACAAFDRALVVVLATLVDTAAPPMAAEHAGGFGAGVVADVGFGTLPDVALGARLFAEWEPAHGWPTLSLGGSSWLPQEIRSGQGLGGSFWGFRADVLVCPTLFKQEGVRLGACAGAALGGIRGRGLGLMPDRASYRLSAQVPVEATLTIRVLAHLALRLAVRIAPALLRPAFYFTGADGSRQIVHRLDAVGGDVQLGFIVDRL